MSSRNQGEPLWLDVPGARLEAVRYGPASEPTLVLLHEGLGSVSAWRELPAQLAQTSGWSVLAYSRDGYGRSTPCALPRPLDYMQRHARDDLAHILDAADVDAHVLVGHSDGASIALAHAGMWPTTGLRGVVAIAPHVFVEDETIAAIEQARVDFQSGDLRRRLLRHHGDNTEHAFWGWNRAWLHPGFRSWNIEPLIEGITVPVLVIQGRQDPYGTLAQVSSIHRWVHGDVAQLLLDAGHAPHRNDPDRVIDAITRFVGPLA